MTEKKSEVFAGKSMSQRVNWISICKALMVLQISFREPPRSKFRTKLTMIAVYEPEET